jgi:hypothetical protein
MRYAAPIAIMSEEDELEGPWGDPTNLDTRAQRATGP